MSEKSKKTSSSSSSSSSSSKSTSGSTSTNNTTKAKSYPKTPRAPRSEQAIANSEELSSSSAISSVLTPRAALSIARLRHNRLSGSASVSSSRTNSLRSAKPKPGSASFTNSRSGSFRGSQSSLELDDDDERVISFFLSLCFVYTYILFVLTMRRLAYVICSPRLA
jgi:hypothetical protein